VRKILITRKLQPIAHELLSKKFQVDENLLPRPLSQEELKEAVQNYDGILSTLADKMNREVLERATRVQAISNCAAGLDNIDTVCAQERKIAIFNLPDIVTDSTADLTFALFLAFVRKVAQGQKYVHDGLWRGWEPGLLLGEELRGKVFGIIGYGKIGKAVAQRAVGFGMKVVAVSRTGGTTLGELCNLADYISLHVPLTPETEQMIDLTLMRKMKKKPVLINMSRGRVIHTDDLVQALQTGLIRGAVLDVTDPEPIPAHHPLCLLDNCMIVPHIGSATIECRTLMAQKAAENLIGYFDAQ
jgi:glyoxylate reductase